MGIGLVKIMGRQSGHIAVPSCSGTKRRQFRADTGGAFDLHGEQGFLHALEQRMRLRRHSVILVAEGAGQEHMFRSSGKIETDASGNLKLLDIGLFLRDAIERHFKEKQMEINLKYIDPSYMIRSVRANASDSIYCSALGQYAAHAVWPARPACLWGCSGESTSISLSR